MTCVVTEVVSFSVVGFLRYLTFHKVV